MGRAKDPTSTPGHPEAGGREGITNDPSGRRRYRAPVTPTAPAPVLLLPPRGDWQTPRRVRYVNEEAVMDPTPRSLELVEKVLTGKGTSTFAVGRGPGGGRVRPLNSAARRNEAVTVDVLGAASRYRDFRSGVRTTER